MTVNSARLFHFCFQTSQNIILWAAFCKVYPLILSVFVKKMLINSIEYFLYEPKGLVQLDWI